MRIDVGSLRLGWRMDLRGNIQKRFIACIMAVAALLAVVSVPSAAVAQLPFDEEVSGTNTVKPLASAVTVGAVPAGLGVCSHNLYETNKAFQLMYAIGIRYIRIDLSWSNIETSPAYYNFGTYDAFVNSATAAGLKIMFIADYSNPLYDNGFSPYDATGDNAYANFVNAAVNHYQGKGFIWEIYNEPQNYWSTASGTLDPMSDASVVAPLYASLANTTETLVKTNFPNETVIGPAVGWFESEDPHWSNTQTFLEDLLQAGIGKKLDAMSVHPYRYVPETVTADYQWLQQQMTANSIGNLPIVSSEWGFNTTQFGTEQNKAQLLARALLVNQMDGIPMSMIYDWQDDGTDTNNNEDTSGLVANYESDYQPGPMDPIIAPLDAFNAVQTFSSQLNGYKYAGQISTGDSTDYILQFKNTAGSDSRYVCWNSAGTAHVVSIPVGANAGVTITNYDGSSVTTGTAGSNGNYQCTESAGVQYIVVTSTLSGSGAAAPSFAFSGTPSTLTINPGSNATTQLSIIPANLFTSAIQLSCGSLPSGITCSFSPATLTPSGTKTMTTQLTVSVSSSAAANHSPKRDDPSAIQFAMTLLGPIVLVPVSLTLRRRKKAMAAILVMLVAICITSTFSGCGGGGSAGSGGGCTSNCGVTPGQQTITVNGVSGSATVTYDLVVNVG